MAKADQSPARAKRRRVSSGRRGDDGGGGHRREGAGEEKADGSSAAPGGGAAPKADSAGKAAAKDREPGDQIEFVTAWSDGSMSDIEDDVPGPVHDDAASDASVLRRALEELRQKKPPAMYKKTTEFKADAQSLTKIVQQALETKDWAPVTAPSFYLRQNVVGQVVRRLSQEEHLALLEACAERYASFPAQRGDCSLWIQQVLEHGGHGLAGHRALREALLPLLKALARRRPPEGHAGEVLAALGRWRLVTELASLRARPPAPGGPGDAAPAAAPAAPPVADGKPQADETQESSSVEDEDDEQEADGEGEDST